MEVKEPEAATVRSSMRSLCDNMKRQILSRAFYGWLSYHRHLKTISLHLVGLINSEEEQQQQDYDDNDDDLFDESDDDGDDIEESGASIVDDEGSDETCESLIKHSSPVVCQDNSGDSPTKNSRKRKYLLGSKKIDEKLWSLMMKSSKKTPNGIRLNENKRFLYKMVYYNGIEHEVREKVWPFLLEHYTSDMDECQRLEKDNQSRELYEDLLKQWRPYEEFIKARDNQKKSICIYNNVLRARKQQKMMGVDPDQLVMSSEQSPRVVTSKPSVAKRSLFRSSRREPLSKCSEECHEELLSASEVNNSNSSSSSLSSASSSSSFSFMNKFPTAKNLFSKLMNPKQHQLQQQQMATTTTMKREDMISNQSNMTDSGYETSKQAESSYLKDMSIIDLDKNQQSPPSLDLNNSDHNTTALSSCNETIPSIDSQIQIAEFVEKIIEHAKQRLDDNHDCGDCGGSSGGGRGSEKENNKFSTLLRKKFLNDDTYVNSTPMSCSSLNTKNERKIMRKPNKLNLIDNNLHTDNNNIDNRQANNNKIENEDELNNKIEASSSSSSCSSAEVSSNSNSNNSSSSSSDALDINLCNQIISSAGSSLMLSPTYSPIETDVHKDVITSTLINLMNPKDKELIDNFALNIHRIDKDVTRCDRNYWYFSSTDNLNKLRNIMYTYVWENLSIGYIQGMCDLVAPLLVIFDNEPLVYSCFKQLMKRMSSNFPHGTAMDQHFSNMRSLIQIMDSDLFEHMQQRGDYTHFFFTYRWFLLDFKREFKYHDVFNVWETIWAAKHVCSEHFNLFIALALIKTYRNTIIDNNMEFTDIIKFFNEMAEKHDTSEILTLARSLIKQLQNIIENNKIAV